MILPLVLAQAALAVSLGGRWEFAREGGAWTEVEVPHDWAIAGPFEPETVGRTGKLPWRGRGTYRRGFVLSAEQGDLLADGGKAYLEFDGVMASPKVRLNGRDVGGWDYGYMSFALDVTAALRRGTNAVEVACSTEHHESRWYPGAGIYRDVRLKVLPREHVVPGSVRIVATEVSPVSATVRVDYVSSTEGPRTKTIPVTAPRLWDVDDPYLYEIELLGERFRYGIRTCAFTADDGFHLNGRRVDIRGVNLHSDLGPLGMAFDRDAAKRQLLLMKDMGVNAVRTSHNAPAPQFLDLCDELGILVWDECFDKWNGTSGREKGANLEEYMERNLKAFVRRDRNHPSVVIWSIGNEIQVDAEGMSAERFRRFRRAIRELDVTRPVGIGACVPKAIASGMFKELDVVGWNYRRDYRKMRDVQPEIPLVYSESASAVSSYGHYANPPTPGKTAFDVAAVETDGYDHNASWGADIPDVEFHRMETDRYCAGEFVWTGIDYLGEPTPWAAAYTNRIGAAVPERELGRSSYFGAADLTGIPKDRFHLYRSHWNAKDETVHLLPHWNWKGGRVPVYVYTSGDEAELFLNGRSLGRRAKQRVDGYPLEFTPDRPWAGGDYRTNDYLRICDRYRLRWHDVAYEPGELKAVAYRKGVRIGEATVRTAGEPVAIRLGDDPFNAPEARTRFVRVEVVDAKGVRCPLAANRMRFRVEGAGRLLAVGNGNARGLDSFAGTEMPLYNGMAVAVVRADGVARLVVEADGLASAALTLAPPAPAVAPGKGPLYDIFGSFGWIEGGALATNGVSRFERNGMVVETRETTDRSGVTGRRTSLRNASGRPQTATCLLDRFVFDGGECEVYTQASSWQHESRGSWQPLKTGVEARSSAVSGCNGASPMLAVWFAQTGRGRVFHLLGDGAWEMHATRVHSQIKEAVVVDVGIDSRHLALPLAPDEEVRLPEIVTYEFTNRTDFDCHRLHAYWNARHPAKGPQPTIYNSWLCRFDRLEPDFVLRQVDRARRLGADYFVLDAGWFGPKARWTTVRGDWDERPDGALGGRMAEISEAVRAAGMKFGFWLEAESADAKSKAVAAHPDWFVVRDGMHFLDFTNPAAFAYIADTACALIAKYGASFLKFDFNQHARTDETGRAFTAYLAGYRAFIREIRRRNPGIYIEGCASGGLMMDLGWAEDFDSFWPSDNESPYHGFRIVKESLVRLPPRMLERWVVARTLAGVQPDYSNVDTRLIACDDACWYRMRSVLPEYLDAFTAGGPVGFSCDLTAFSDADLDRFATTLAARRRESGFWNAAVGRIVCDTPTLTALQYSDEALSDVRLYVIPDIVHQATATVRPVLDPACDYTVDGTPRTAADLSANGITVRTYDYKPVCVRLRKR